MGTVTTSERKSREAFSRLERSLDCTLGVKGDSGVSIRLGIVKVYVVGCSCWRFELMDGLSYEHVCFDLYTPQRSIESTYQGTPHNEGN